LLDKEKQVGGGCSNKKVSGGKKYKTADNFIQIEK